MSYDSFIEVNDGPSSVSSSETGPSSVSSSETMASLSFEKHTCESLWEIVNFSSTVSANQDYFSPSFAPSDKTEYRWFIGLRTVEQADGEYVEIFLKPDFFSLVPENGGCRFTYTLFAENVDFRRIAEWNLESRALSAQDRTIHRVKRSFIQSSLVNDELLLRADITFELLPDGGNQGSLRSCASIGSSRFVGDLSSMLGKESFSDVLISVDDEGTQHDIPAHQVVLAARSSFFRAKLTQDTPESRNRVINITNLGIRTVNNMLSYIYTDQFDSSLSTEHVIQLLKCSEKYSISGLKTHCERHLKRRVNDSNVFNCLAAADLFNARELKNRCLEIICQNRRNIGRIKEALTSSFVEMTQEQRLTLLTEIVMEVTSRFHPN